MLFLFGLLAAQAADPEALVKQYCTSCHPIEIVVAKKRTADEWTEVILRMMDHGLNATPEELEAIRDYLAKTQKP